MRKRNKVIELDIDFFLITDATGGGHLYSKHPNEIEDNKLVEYEVDIVQKILGLCSGFTDKDHPIKVQVKFQSQKMKSPYELPIMYILTDRLGYPHLLSADPADINFDEMRYKRFLVDFNDTIVTKVGSTISRESPVSVRARYIPAPINSPFNLDIVNAIAKKDIEAHYEDNDGNVVFIDPVKRHDDPNCPLVGEVYHSKTREFRDIRFYSITGECFDGIEEHSLETVLGYAFGERIPIK